MTNSLQQITEFGQSVWLDYISRNLILSGELKRMIEEDGLRGMTSNPTIFEKAIGGSQDYDAEIREVAQAGKSVQEIYEAISVHDVQAAADTFRPLYDQSQGNHGFVSLEVNPHLAHDTDATINEARRLWRALCRPNVFIKVPATLEGLPAIRQLISEEINVNVTLLFGLPRYRKVAEAYVAGLEDRLGQSRSLTQVCSVASFFLSRIDVLIDPILEKNPADAKLAKELRGGVAIASAKIAYQIYKETFGGKRFQQLAEKGAHPQRVLWASTGTKNPEYSDVRYVEALIGPETINTMPVETFHAFRDHGRARASLEEDMEKAREILDRLPAAGIDINKITQQLEDEGIEKFNKPFDSLMATLEKKRSAASQKRDG